MNTELTPLLTGAVIFGWGSGIVFTAIGVYLSIRGRRLHPLLLLCISAISFSWIEAPYDWAMYAQFPPALPRMPSWWPLNMTWGGLPSSVPVGYIGYFVLPAVIGPSVPLARAAQSLRWARHARALVQVGVIPDGNGPVRCDQHLSTLLVLADEDLAAALCDRRLAPLARLRPAQRDRIAETLLAWLQLGENAAEVAQRIHVHPQTVRYRLRQITELFGDQLRDPDTRFELQLALRIRTLSRS